MSKKLKVGDEVVWRDATSLEYGLVQGYCKQFKGNILVKWPCSYEGSYKPSLFKIYKDLIPKNFNYGDRVQIKDCQRLGTMYDPSTKDDKYCTVEWDDGLVEAELKSNLRLVEAIKELPKPKIPYGKLMR